MEYNVSNQFSSNLLPCLSLRIKALKLKRKKYTIFHKQIKDFMPNAKMPMLKQSQAHKNEKRKKIVKRKKQFTSE